MNIDLMKITQKQFKQVFEESISRKRKLPQLIFQTKRFKQIRNYIRNYAENNGLYFIELDEFTDGYIDRVVRLYQDMSDNDFTIIYLRMYDCIDYSTPQHRQALHKLYNILNDQDCNLQFVIDYHITSKTYSQPDIYSNMGVMIWNKCYTWQIK